MMPTVRVNGIRLHYEEHGTGDPILAIHGTSGSAMTWAGASEALSKLGRVILYDRRGTGREESPPEFLHLNELTAAAIPASRTVLVGRGHMIDPAGSEIMQFITAVLAGQQTTSDATGSAVRAP